MEFVDENLEVTELNSLSEYVLESTLKLDKLYHYRRDIYNWVMEQFALISGEYWEDDDEKEEEDSI
jgi:hypothetical protein